jgi:hypothetical protein
MQVAKGDQNIYLVPWGITGPPYTGGYKCGGLALQDGEWAKSRQHVIAKMLLGNLKCDLGTVKMSGIDLGSVRGLMR